MPWNWRRSSNLCCVAAEHKQKLELSTVRASKQDKSFLKETSKSLKVGLAEASKNNIRPPQQVQLRALSWTNNPERVPKSHLTCQIDYEAAYWVEIPLSRFKFMSLFIASSPSREVKRLIDFQDVASLGNYECFQQTKM